MIRNFMRGIPNPLITQWSVFHLTIRGERHYFCWTSGKVPNERHTYLIISYS